MTGKITRIVPVQGLGFIAGEDGRDYVFHHSALVPAGEVFDELLQGEAVTFDPVHAHQGPRAEVVRLMRPGEPEK